MIVAMEPILSVVIIKGTDFYVPGSSTSRPFLISSTAKYIKALIAIDNSANSAVTIQAKVNRTFTAPDWMDWRPVLSLVVDWKLVSNMPLIVRANDINALKHGLATDFAPYRKWPYQRSTLSQHRPWVRMVRPCAHLSRTFPIVS